MESNGIAILTQQMQLAPIVLYTMVTADGATGDHLVSLGSHDACSRLVRAHKATMGRGKPTLNIGNALLENLLQNLGVLKLLLDLANDGLGKLTLLALLDLGLVADPGVKNLLGLGSESGALLELVGLGLQLGSFLQDKSGHIPRTYVRIKRILPWKQRTAAW